MYNSRFTCYANLFGIYKSKYLCTFLLTSVFYIISKSKEWAEDLDTEELKVFTVAKRHGWFHHWEPIHITTHEEPLFDERLTYHCVLS